MRKWEKVKWICKWWKIRDERMEKRQMKGDEEQWTGDIEVKGRWNVWEGERNRDGVCGG